MSRINEHLNSLNLQRVITIVVILFLMIFITLSFDIIQAKVKDSKRKADLGQIRSALAMYQLKHGEFPEVENPDVCGWDLSYKEEKNDTFLNVLIAEGFVDQELKDPVNSSRYHYRYQKFPANSFGCKDPFYVLQAVSFENKNKDIGYGKCLEKDFTEEVSNGYTIQVFE